MSIKIFKKQFTLSDNFKDILSTPYFKNNSYFKNIVKDKIMLFDIETTGLNAKTSYVYLIGAVYYENNIFMLSQFFIENLKDEKELLKEFLEFSNNFELIISYNGLNFDFPYIDYKIKKYKLEACLLDNPFGFCGKSTYRLDIYKLIKPYKKILEFPNLKQKTLEKFLGFNRKDNFSGKDLIEIYAQFTGLRHYEKLIKSYNINDNILYENGNSSFDIINKAAEFEKLLLLHNLCDLKGLFSLLTFFNIISFFKGDFKVSGFLLMDIDDINDNNVISNNSIINKTSSNTINDVMDNNTINEAMDNNTANYNSNTIKNTINNIVKNFFINECNNNGIKPSGMKILKITTIPNCTFSFPESYSHSFELPMPDCGIKLNALIHSEDSCINIYIPALFCELYYFYSDYKNYYYLPMEGYAIHKSVAEYVDKAHRIKATKENCKKNVSTFFIPQAKTVMLPEFKLNYKNKISFFRADIITDNTYDSNSLCCLLREYILSTLFDYTS